MSEAAIKNNGARVHELGRTGTTIPGIVSDAEFIRLPSGDLCDCCRRTNMACSLRCEAHQESLPVRSCSHYKHNVVPIMVVGSNGMVI